MHVIPYLAQVWLPLYFSWKMYMRGTLRTLSSVITYSLRKHEDNLAEREETQTVLHMTRTVQLPFSMQHTRELRLHLWSTACIKKKFGLQWEWCCIAKVHFPLQNEKKWHCILPIRTVSGAQYGSPSATGKVGEFLTDWSCSSRRRSIDCSSIWRRGDGSNAAHRSPRAPTASSSSGHTSGAL